MKKRHFLLRMILIIAMESLAVSCRQGSSTSYKRHESPASFDIETMTEMYGSPIDNAQIRITEQHDEFRTKVQNCFSKEERSSRRMVVHEVTWRMNDKDSLITVWYLPEADTLRALCHLEHSVYALD